MVLPLMPFIPPGVLWAADVLSARSATKNAIIRTAILEWIFFEQQRIESGRVVKRGRRENEDGWYQRVGVYWREGTGKRYDGRNRSLAWSSTFIAYCMVQAGVEQSVFRRTIRHSEYIHDAIQNRYNNTPGAKFKGYELLEHAPQPGDLVCYSRAGSNMTYAKAARQSKYKSHGDIVVSAMPGQLMVIGGNVADSVSLKVLTTDSLGYLNDRTQKWFCVIENLLPVR